MKHQTKHDGRGWRQPRTPRSACRLPTAAAAGSLPPGDEAPLRSWLTARGGRLHTALRLVDAAPCGARGVVAGAPVSLCDLDEGGPVVVVPKALHLESGAARRLLAAWGGDACADVAAEALGDAMLVAVALAHEAALGGASAWAPYLASLPGAPPAPWLLRGAELRAAAAAALATGAPSGGSGGSARGGASRACGGGTVDEWVRAAEARGRATRAAVEGACEHLVPVAAAAAGVRRGGVAGDGGGGSGGGAPLTPDGWLTPGALLHALGHVQSRSLGTSGSSGLVPVVDLLNHSGDARPPMLELDAHDSLVISVLPMAGGDAVALSAGDELCINYGSHAPLEGWLKFGFVAPEWWC